MHSFAVGFGRGPIALSSALVPSSGVMDSIWTYPYDTYVVNYRLEAVYRLLSSNDDELDRGRIDCNYYIDLKIAGWDSWARKGTDVSYPLKLDIYRPLSVRLFVPISIAVILFVYLAIWFVSDIGVVVQASTSLALGIWVMRQSLVPTSSPGTMAIDFGVVVRVRASDCPFVGGGHTAHGSKAGYG